VHKFIHCLTVSFWHPGFSMFKIERKGAISIIYKFTELTNRLSSSVCPMVFVLRISTYNQSLYHYTYTHHTPWWTLHWPWCHKIPTSATETWRPMSNDRKPIPQNCTRWVNSIGYDGGGHEQWGCCYCTSFLYYTAWHV
jgi:hypothetical protein